MAGSPPGLPTVRKKSRHARAVLLQPMTQMLELQRVFVGKPQTPTPVCVDDVAQERGRRLVVARRRELPRCGEQIEHPQAQVTNGPFVVGRRVRLSEDIDQVHDPFGDV
jgi:hypothetical protein